MIGNLNVRPHALVILLNKVTAFGMHAAKSVMNKVFIQIQTFKLARCLK
jgi:hypothetical protein